MKDIFTHDGNQKGTRSGDTFRRPNIDTVKKGDRSLRSFGPIVWNTMIPDKLKQCESLNDFQSSIKSWKPENCPCELCKTYVQGVGYVALCD